MHKFDPFKNICEFNLMAAVANIVFFLLAPNLLYQPVYAATQTKAPVVSKTPKVVDKPADIKSASRKASTAVATLRVYTKASDLKIDTLIKSQLKSAFSADNADNNPDANNRTAAELNVDINETLAANLFRQAKFDLNELDNIDKENFILGNLTHGNVIHIAKGNALFVPKNNIVVLADLADIHIGAGSMVGVLRPSPDIVSIYDLEDTGSKKVSIKVGDETIALSPGKNLIISKEKNEFEKINPAHRIAYRKLESKKLKSGFYAYTSEFSISSAVLHVRPLQNILLSNDPEDQKIANRLVKNYVILEDVFGNGEPFKMPASIVAPVKISSR
jgi:hypothetical protein